MSSLEEQIGEQIKQYRKQRNLTQQELGERMGVAKSTVASYEAGRNNFTVTTLERLAKSLDGELVVKINLK